MTTPEPPDVDLDLDARELCGDDACIGVIGPSGVCGECGRTREQAALGVARAVEEAASVAEPDMTGALDEDRELCGDDTCIGVIGPDGRCRECGRPRGPAGPASPLGT